ncbi:MAG: ABC transporter ATP-binding protein [candidate division NC10 bacterium]|nr:ABC transporter ATP-binding protein [candidate division NC10 bacterium]
MAMLETNGLMKSFGRMVAVDRVDLSVREGELTAVIGPNGAGKTTLFNVVTGKLRPTAGQVRFRGEDITGLPPHAVIRRGIGRSFQVTNLFPELSALDSLRVAVLSERRLTGRVLPAGALAREAEEEADRLLRELGLGEHRDRPCRTLSHADQRAVEIGLALAARPRLLLLDEPTAGMGPEETAAMVTLLRGLARRDGLTLLLVEHDMHVVFALAERIVVMHHGRIIADGPPVTVRENPGVREAYLGEPGAGS